MRYQGLHELVQEVVDRAGSQVKAAKFAGVGVRDLQKWCAGSSRPSPRNLWRIRVALEGDNAIDREARIARYTDLAQRQITLFD